MSLSELGNIKATIQATIRPCNEADLPALEWMGLYTPHRGIIRETFEAQQRGDALMLLAVSEGFPIAQVWLDFACKRAELAAVLWAVRTFYPLQRAGVGSQMIRAAEKVARGYDFRWAELEVEESHEHAVRFYCRLGWRKVETSDHGLWIMTKEISPL